jgi:ElaA protein
MEWTLKSFDELTTGELYNILKMRVDVFVVEQDCAYPEIDGHDQRSLHLFSIQDGVIAAYARLVPAGEKYNQASIGRVLVTPSKRKSGLGRKLIAQAISVMIEKWEVEEIQLQAQSHLQSFYGSFGFEATSEVYDDGGIPHVDMLLKVR